MALESILEHILKEARIQKEKIIKDAKAESAKIIQEAKLQAQKLYEEILSQEKAWCEKKRQKLVVNTRLGSKKRLLLAKQEIIDSVFKELKPHLSKAKLKKQEIGHEKTHEVYEDVNFYLKQIRPEYEAEIAKLLF